MSRRWMMLRRMWYRVLGVVLLAGMLTHTSPVRGADNRLVWASAFGGANYDLSMDIAVDVAGNRYTTGYFRGTADFDPGLGSDSRTSEGLEDIFVSKLDVSGNVVWARTMGGEGYDVGDDIAVDAVGNVYVTGEFASTVDFDPGVGVTTRTSAGLSDIFVVKLNTNGNLVWVSTIEGLEGGRGNSIAVDTTGNVYLTGGFLGTADFDPGPGSTMRTSSGWDDIFVTKLDADGNLVWVGASGSGNNDRGNSIAVDAAGNVYVTGEFSGRVDFDFGPGSTTRTGIIDIFVSKLDTDGNLVWVSAMGGASNDAGESIAIDTTGNVYVTGYFQSTADFDPGHRSTMRTSQGIADIFVSKLDVNGDLVWVGSMGGASNGYDGGYSIAVDTTGSVYTTGYFRDTADFDPGSGIATRTSAGFLDIFVSKLDANGNFESISAIGGDRNDAGTGIVVDAERNISIAGLFSSTVDFDPGPGSAIRTSAGGEDSFVSTLTQPQAQLTIMSQLVRSGTEASITITISNQGPSAADGVLVAIPIPSNLDSFSWQCSATGGAICPTASGSGAISQVVDTFPADGTVTFSTIGTISQSSARITGTVSFTAPVGVTLDGPTRFLLDEYLMLLPVVRH